jgi:DNA-directed RNA polymerase II subunit RPB1
MPKSHQATIPRNNPSKIIGIQFCMLSPDEIRKGSVAEITSRDTYVGNKPVIGGLFDPRMGVQEPGLICPTDGLDYMQTPGYFGHMELAKPVFYIQYLPTVIKILRCVCCQCSKLLISKEKHKHILSMDPEHRWNHVFSLANKVKRCGEDTEDGCNCKQPNKIKKEGLATIFAEWDNIEGLGPEDTDKLNMRFTPEIVLKIFRRISDEDVNFMGFSPVWSRPDWMVCQVLAVPPPAVRPSVKHDAQQRSEDDISHIIVNMIKANKTLQEKIAQNAPANVIDDWTTVLQYYVATQIDNKIPGVASVAQRSGRPLKSVKERLNGKGGRVRGNLMGKRVDFSARSVITPDPNLSIRELGIPMKIAKNITKPVIVNEKNKNYLTKLVMNGPDEYPGAKILEKRNGENISLRYVDRESLRLEIGDTVHRHMMDGDGILFNRQPTLHRMSMMCHIARIMKKGDTFRMNVGDTKPYNADFDGDEMNLHMPQDEESETELKQLAAVPWQIISPANNQSIVGIFQDSLLGAYRFTRKDINFTSRDAMNLLMSYNKVDTAALRNQNDMVSNFEIISQILPPLSLTYKTKLFGDDEDKETSNNVLEIKDGEYIRGHMEKSVLGAGSKGLIHRICNDFGNMKAADFIDDIQNVITEYMKASAYSVGISDLIANKATNEAIAEIISTKKQQVKNIIDQTQLGVFENNTGKTNQVEFETKVNEILDGAAKQAGRIGRKSLSKDNRFVIMVEAGSKGSDLNISQMISCLGQQNVDGKRIPYGFNNRTLPHYTQYDDGPSARGFVESSFIGGLTPQELFFHAMGGRVGLIDTAVKTSQTGYIQRRLIKGMEDAVILYDMTVRNSKGKIIQYAYGDDGIDTVKVENQLLPLVNMTLEEIYSHFSIVDMKAGFSPFITATQTRMRRQSDQYTSIIATRIADMIELRNSIVENVFHHKDNSIVNIPVSFMHIINNVQGQQGINKNSLVDVTLLEANEMINAAFSSLEEISYCPPTMLFKAAFYYYLSPKELLVMKRFNKRALAILLDTIVLSYKQAIVAPGETVGMIAAQSIGEPTTQMTLNTFHFAGVASKSNVTRGVPRIEEILSLSENPKNPSLTVYLPQQSAENQERAQTAMNMLEYTNLRQLVSSMEICFDPNDDDTLIEEDRVVMEQYKMFETLVDECAEAEPSLTSDKKSKWIVRLELDKETMLEKNITMDDINYAIRNSYDDEVSCVYSDYNSDKLIFRLRLDSITSKKKGVKANTLDQSDEIYYLKNFQDNLLDNLVLRGVKNISKVILRKLQNVMTLEEGNYNKKDMWVLDTVGTNLLDVLALDYIDSVKTISNDIAEVYRTLGIEAARQMIYDEIAEVIEFDGTYINYHHLSLLCDRMTSSWKMISIFRHGINNDNIGPIAKASFEETPEMFLKAARHGEMDIMRGVSANVMCGQEGYFGTNSFQVILDLQEMNYLEDTAVTTTTESEQIDSLFGKMEDPRDPCNKSNIIIHNNVSGFKVTQRGVDPMYNPGF